MTDVERPHPDHLPRLDHSRDFREGATIPDNDYAPEHSRLIFNEWRGLYVRPAKTIETALRLECNDKLDHMLSLVTNRHARAVPPGSRRHLGWTLKHPGRKQQVALVCTGDQGTGKSFLCTTFAQAVFPASTPIPLASGRSTVSSTLPAISASFGSATTSSISNFDNAEIPQDVDPVRLSRVGRDQGARHCDVYDLRPPGIHVKIEANPGISRGRDDRGLFQVTSITAQSEGILPGEFQTRMKKEIAPFYEDYAAFLERDAVRQAYVSMC